MNSEISSSMIGEFAEKALKEISPYLLPHWEIDHVCYRTDSFQHYERSKACFSGVGNLLTESLVGGRPIATYELNNPIPTTHGFISFVEVPAPKPGRKIESGYEHLEVVVDLPFHVLLEKNPDLDWDTRAINKKINPEMEANFTGFNVKFHHHALNHIIEIEKNIKASEFISKLEQFHYYLPLIAGTIPLGIAMKDSDLNILMQAQDFDKLGRDILIHFPDAKIYSDHEKLTANFMYGDLPIEIYAEPVIPLEQKAYRHLRIEGRLLRLMGLEFKNKIIALKNNGLKTEPAFGKLLHLSDPYEELLEMYWLSDEDLYNRLKLF